MSLLGAVQQWQRFDRPQGRAVVYSHLSATSRQRGERASEKCRMVMMFSKGLGEGDLRSGTILSRPDIISGRAKRSQPLCQSGTLAVGSTGSVVAVVVHTRFATHQYQRLLLSQSELYFGDACCSHNICHTPASKATCPHLQWIFGRGKPWQDLPR